MPTRNFALRSNCCHGIRRHDWIGPYRLRRYPLQTEGISRHTTPQGRAVPPAAAVALASAGQPDPARCAARVARVSSAHLRCRRGGLSGSDLCRARPSVLSPSAALVRGSPRRLRDASVDLRALHDGCPSRRGRHGQCARRAAGACGSRIRGDRAAVLAALAMRSPGWFRDVAVAVRRGGGALLTRVATTELATAHAHLWRDDGQLHVPVLFAALSEDRQPAAARNDAAQYADQNGMSGNVVAGLYGLLISPNHGIYASPLAAACCRRFSRLQPQRGRWARRRSGEYSS